MTKVVTQKMVKKKLTTTETGSFSRDWALYVLFLPAFIWIFCFKLLPLPGIMIAFKDFNVFEGFFASDWVGLKYFKEFFTQERFLNVLVNTLQISGLKILFLFPLPIIFAILLNEIRVNWYKRSIQTIIYLPHFLSFVIIHGLFVNILSTQNGIVNEVITYLGFNPVDFYTNDLFRFVLLLTEGFKDVGWGTIVYLAALAGVDSGLYEAAEVDGATRFQQMVYITLPSIVPIVMLMLTLRIGSIMAAGTEQILAMYNPTVYKTADIVGTLTYREGIGAGNFGFASAVGLFESLVAFVLTIGANTFCSKVFKRGLW